MSNGVLADAAKDFGAIAASAALELQRIDQLRDFNAVALHMSRVHSANLKELGEQIDAANRSLAFARQQQRNAEAAARQTLATARAEAAKIVRGARVQQASNHLKEPTT
jgi:hypothetical protein